MTRTLVFAAISLVIAPHLLAQATLVVPSAQFPTIQSAIDATSNGDTVQVGPGTYVENISFRGRTISVIGAGPGLSILDGSRAGPVVSINAFEGPGTRLEGFTIQNGIGLCIVLGLNMLQLGGGVLVQGVVQAVPGTFIVHADIVNCEIKDNIAARGAGVAVLQHANVRLLDCDIHDNTTIDPLVMTTFTATGNAGLAVIEFSDIRIERCLFRRNSSNGGAGLGGSAGGLLYMCDSVIEDNSALDVPQLPNQTGNGGGAGLSNATVERCIFRNNSAMGITGGVGIANGTLIDCLITGNTADQAAAVLASGAPSAIINCTITDNTSTRDGSTVAAPFIALSIDNSILWNNPPAETFLFPPLSSVTINHSIVTGGHPGTGNLDTDPLFVDPMNGDLHLSLTSPCIDAASGAVTGLPATDIDGEPRTLFGAPDMGADEASDIALHPSVRGTVGAGAGGPFDVLTVNGQSGGLDRRVRLSIGQPLAIEMARPPTNQSPARFALWGMLAEPRYFDPFVLPFGIGEMAFVPCPVLPGLQPFLFTVTNNAGTSACAQGIPSSPAPWNTPQLPGIPFPFRFALQGVIEETSGVYRTTNAVIVVVQ